MHHDPTIFPPSVIYRCFLSHFLTRSRPHFYSAPVAPSYLVYSHTVNV